jgi:hypothetical protein
MKRLMLSDFPPQTSPFKLNAYCSYFSVIDTRHRLNIVLMPVF